MGWERGRCGWVREGRMAGAWSQGRWGGKGGDADGLEREDGGSLETGEMGWERG